MRRWLRVRIRLHLGSTGEHLLVASSPSNSNQVALALNSRQSRAQCSQMEASLSSRLLEISLISVAVRPKISSNRKLRTRDSIMGSLSSRRNQITQSMISWPALTTMQLVGSQLRKSNRRSTKTTAMTAAT